MSDITHITLQPGQSLFVSFQKDNAIENRVELTYHKTPTFLAEVQHDRWDEEKDEATTALSYFFNP